MFALGHPSLAGPWRWACASFFPGAGPPRLELASFHPRQNQRKCCLTRPESRRPRRHQPLKRSHYRNPRRLSSSIHPPAKRKNGVGLGFSKPSIHDAPKAQLLGHHSLIHDFYTRNALSHPHPEVPGISRKKVGAISGNRGIENWPVFFCKFQWR